jgi:hypothetical protein
MRSSALSRVVTQVVLGISLTICCSGNAQLPEPIRAEWSQRSPCVVRGKSYTLKLTSDRIRKTPGWDATKSLEPEISPGKALNTARRELTKTFSDASRWGVQSINLEQCFQIPGVLNDLWDRWYYTVTFSPPEAQPGPDSPQSYRVYVLMDGGVVTPSDVSTDESEPDGPANRIQPIRAETNSTSSAAGSGR